MTAVGTGVREIRIRTRQEHRVIYVAQFPEAVYVLHAFEKHSQKASRLDIALARKRLSELIISRRTTEDS